MGETSKVPERVIGATDDSVLHIRLLTGGNYLNPQQSSLPLPSSSEIGTVDELQKTHSLLNKRSSIERDLYWKTKAQEDPQLAIFEQQYTNWKKSMEDLISREDNKTYVDELRRINLLGNKQNGTDVDLLYQRYFDSTVVNSAQLFIEDILKAYEYDVNLILSQRETITWIASIFGENSKLVIDHLVQACAKVSTSEGKTELLEQAKTKWQEPLSSDNARLLIWLYGNDNLIEAEKKIEPPEDYQPNKPEIERTIVYREEPISVESMFTKLKKPIDKTNQTLMNEWFVQSVQDDISLTSDQKQGLVLQPEPFLDSSRMTNKKQNPQVYDFYDVDSRFMEATELTNDDSSMLALSAIVAETPKDQARLYRELANALLQINEMNPQLMIEYMKVQDQRSFEMFVSDDSKRRQNGESEDYMLVPGTENDLNETNFTTVWNTRLQELRQAVDRNEFTMYHHRWIEALSRTVDIKKLFTILRAQ